MRICLVSCCKTKLSRQAKAEDLYQSPLFKKSRALAEAAFDRWFILSAKHGLVDPEQILRPYDKTLLRMSKPERLAWSELVTEQISEVTKPGDEVTFLAGEWYRMFTDAALKQAGRRVKAPLAGLGLGKQLQWLNMQLEMHCTVAEPYD
jgi:hypothetical protein